MKKYYIIFGTLGLLFVASFAALCLNRQVLPPTPFGGTQTIVLETTVAGNIAITVAVGLIIAAAAALIIYRIYSRIHKKINSERR